MKVWRTVYAFIHDDALDAMSSMLEFLKKSITYQTPQIKYEAEDEYTGY